MREILTDRIALAANKNASWHPDHVSDVGIQSPPQRRFSLPTPHVFRCVSMICLRPLPVQNREEPVFPVAASGLHDWHARSISGSARFCHQALRLNRLRDVSGRIGDFLEPINMPPLFRAPGLPRAFEPTARRTDIRRFRRRVRRRQSVSAGACVEER